MGKSSKIDDKRIGNQFWKLRSRHGRTKLFSDPNLLWEAACEYFQWCDDNPWIKYEQVKQMPRPQKKQDGEYEMPSSIVAIPTARPYTLSGLCLYLGCDDDTFKAYGKDEDKKEFFGVVRAIREVIDTQQFEGASVGAFNASIIARKLGLIDKQEVNNKGVIQHLNSEPLSKDELKKFNDILEQDV